jgi:mono/diheme cytochrome c family protein
MKQRINLLIFSVLLAVVLLSCQNSGEKKKVETVNSEQLSKEITNKLPSTTEKVLPGKAVFTQYCLQCHQADGSGVPGMHPPLGQGSWVGRDPKELVAVLIKGLNGKVEVNGEIYNNFMPSQAQLTDEEMADVLTYVRASFGNNYGPVDAALVKKVRSGK